MKTLLALAVAAVAGGAVVYFWYNQKSTVVSTQQTPITCNCQHEESMIEVPTGYTMG